jgi:hypothetical protein
MVKLKYKELRPDEQAIVDQFKARDQEIKDLTAQRNAEKKSEDKRIRKERKETDEYAEIKAMSGGIFNKERNKLFHFYNEETDKMVKERKEEIEAEFEEKLNYRKVGGDATGLTLVGEEGPEIVEFKTAVNIVPAHRTQETMKTLSESGGTNIIAMDLPPISTPLPEVNVTAPPSTETERIPSVNPFNSYMVMTPEILRIS